MKRNAVIACVFILAGLVSVSVYVVVRGNAAYRAAMLSTPPSLQCVSDSPRLRILATEREAGLWTIVGEGENAYEELFRKLQLPPGIEGYAALYGFTPVPFSALDFEGNQRRAAIAIARTGLVPQTDDGKFHLSEDLSFGAIFSSEDIVSYHRLVHGRWIGGSMIRRKSATDNPDDAQRN